MAHNTKPDTLTDDCVGESGEPVLWNPDVSVARWHWEKLRAVVRRNSVWLCGTLLIGCGTFAGPAAAPFIAVGGLIVSVGVLARKVSGAPRDTCFETGRCSCTDQRCRIGDEAGTFFYRSNDLADLGPAPHAIATQAIDAAIELQRTPARRWLDPALPAAAHRLAWQILSTLERTRTARILVAGLSSRPSSTGRGEALGDAIDRLDCQLDEAARNLAGCVMLAREWTDKLRDLDLRERAGTELGLLGALDHDQLVRATELLLQKEFFSVTAARDLTHADRFSWERPRSTWPPGRAVVLVQHGPRTTPTIDSGESAAGGDHGHD